jgi:hypothetical protein
MFVLQANFSGKVPGMLASIVARELIGGEFVASKARFERSGTKVDRELRDVAPQPPLEKNLDSGQKAIVRKCMAMDASVTPSSSPNSAEQMAMDASVTPSSSPNSAEQTASGWTALNPAFPFIKSYMKVSNENSRQVLYVKSECVIDGAPQAVAQSYYEYCSRVRMKKSQEMGDPARIRVEAVADHDSVYATIKKLKWPLSDREVVFRQIICTTDFSSREFLVASESKPEDYVVDYGESVKQYYKKKSFLRVNNTMGLFKVSPYEGDREMCACSLVVNWEPGGIFNRIAPLKGETLGDRSMAALNFFVNIKSDSIVAKNLELVQKEHERNEEIDETRVKKKMEIIMNSPQVRPPLRTSTSRPPPLTHQPNRRRTPTRRRA